MKPRWQGFCGPIAAPLERYLRYKHALGCSFRTEERTLQLLGRFLIERGIETTEQIESELLEAFLASRPRSRPSSYNHLFRVVRRLFDLSHR